MVGWYINNLFVSHHQLICVRVAVLYETKIDTRLKVTRRSLLKTRREKLLEVCSSFIFFPQPLITGEVSDKRSAFKCYFCALGLKKKKRDEERRGRRGRMTRDGGSRGRFVSRARELISCVLFQRAQREATRSICADKHLSVMELTRSREDFCC